MENNVHTYNPHVSVDCVIFGFDGEKLKILLIERTIEEQNFSDKKLPGSIIFEEEDLNEAASRILNELTGLKNIYLNQFHSFGSPGRTKNVRDRNWLERLTNTKIGRIVTVGYVALIKINRKIIFESENTTAKWYDISSLKSFQLAFDHNEIADFALEHIRYKVKLEPSMLFELLPQKFTMTQLRNLYDVIMGVTSDVRNFKKKMLQMEGLEQLDEVQKDVPYRAPRLYRFDKKLYKKNKRNI